MDIVILANELSQMHIDYAKLLAQIANALCANGETGVLLWLSQQEKAVYATDIIEHFGLSPGRVANILKRLEQQQLIERQADADDQRRLHISLTEKGISCANAFYDQMNSCHAHMLEALGQEDAAEGMRILRRVISLVNGGIELHLKH